MGGLTDSARNWLRRLLRIRKPRRVLPRRPKPPPGARVCLDDLRFTMPPGMDDELWQWLQELGWREVSFRPERRSYRDLSSSRVAQLLICPASRRQGLLEAAIAEAGRRSSALLRR
jgi:hypothetical protein